MFVLQEALPKRNRQHAQVHANILLQDGESSRHTMKEKGGKKSAIFVRNFVEDCLQVSKRRRRPYTRCPKRQRSRDREGKSARMLPLRNRSPLVFFISPPPEQRLALRADGREKWQLLSLPSSVARIRFALTLGRTNAPSHPAEAAMFATHSRQQWWSPGNLFALIQEHEQSCSSY